MKTGKWYISSDGYYPYCSECGYEPEDGNMTDFCPQCGADMREKERKTGKWIETFNPMESSGFGMKCSECGHITLGGNYCSWCGAKMVGVKGFDKNKKFKTITEFKKWLIDDKGIDFEI